MTRLTDSELDEAFEHAHGSLRLTTALSELKERRQRDLTSEERHWLSLLPGVVEAVYHRAEMESVVNGTQPPKRENIDKTIAVLDKLLAGSKP